MAFDERESFDLRGPLHLTYVDWNRPYDRKSVAASLVQGVYILEKDRQKEREGRSSALAPPWWSFFHFQLVRTLVDDVDSSIFGAIFEFNPPPSHRNYNTILHNNNTPHYVIAFRGTIIKRDSIKRDLELDMGIIRNGLHKTSRYQIAIQTVREMVSTVGHSNIWLAGHSLGSAIALLCGKTMGKNGIFIESFLFNPPYASVAPIESIKDDYEKLKNGLRIAGSLFTVGLTVIMKAAKQMSTLPGEEYTFAALSDWVPCLFVNKSDVICAEYCGYFEHKTKMEEIGAGFIERVATQNSFRCHVKGALGMELCEPMHLIPSALLTVNLTPSRGPKEAHGISQWWKPELHLESKLYKY